MKQTLSLVGVVLALAFCFAPKPEATYLPSAIKSIQAGTCTAANGSATGTATITSVNASSSVVYRTGEAQGESDYSNYARLTLTNATTVTCTHNAGQNAATMNFTVIEYLPQFIKSVQQGVAGSQGIGVASSTGTITAVNTAKSAIFYEGTEVTAATSTGNVNDEWGRCVITNSTTVTCTRDNAVNNTVSFGFTVLEFK